MSGREMAGWALVAAGAVFGVLAAGIQGGFVAALSAASASCTAAAAVLGYVSKAPAAKP